MQTISGTIEKRVGAGSANEPISDGGEQAEARPYSAETDDALADSWRSPTSTTVELPPVCPPGLLETRTGATEELAAGNEQEPSTEELAREEKALTSILVDAPTPAPEAPATPRSRSPESGTAISLYLREIGQVKLLTPQEELALAARIQAGDKKAREQMIKANLRLVVKIARDYEGIGLPLLDLISEGNIGLMKAVERFDPAKGAKLSTYAAWWIKQSMKRALATQSKTIRLPVHMVDKISRMRRSAVHLHEELGREPTDEELAEEMGTTAKRVGEMRMAALPPTSLDAPINADDSTQFSEIVEDEKADSPYEHLKTKTVAGMLRDMVKVLSAREAFLVKARFGLDGNQCKTLDEVGVQLGVTRERVRQLQNNALAKLRKMLRRIEAAQT